MLKENLNRLWAYLIVDELAANGSCHFFLSPGHRNAPLIAALEAHPKCHIHLGIDERAQAYQALGFAKSSKTVPVLICTSGTALANYLPAMIEAHKTNHSLFVLSADRPNDVTMLGDNQTLEQNNFYNKDIAAFLTLGAPSEEISPTILRRGISNLLTKAKSTNLNSHFNLPFYAPMDSTEKKISDLYIQEAERTLNKKQIVTNWPNHILTDDVIGKISTLKSTLFVLGPEITLNFAQKLRQTYPEVPFLIDVQSPAHYQQSMSPSLNSLDLNWCRELIKENPPEQILHFGDLLVSKYFYETLKTIKNLEYWNFHQSSDAKDPAAIVTHKILINANDACHALINQKIKINPLKISKEYHEREVHFCEQLKNTVSLTFCDLINTTTKQKLIDSNLFIGNSTMIRAFEKYAHKGDQFIPQIFSNRGVSGIEGNIATAIGISKGNNKKTVSLIGDISFLYDLNSLGLLRTSSQPQIIIVANNRGGGIFKMLNFKGFEKIAPFMTTPHEIDLEKLALAYQITFHKIQKIEDLDSTLSKSFTANSHQIIEVLIDDEVSMKRSETLDL
jgi:2-succinyl-5-enolpyruvyl-6-hydroxy-3-cyclohexene-1-carboxylate synthase